jgi:prevent-host-death family protein
MDIWHAKEAKARFRDLIEAARGGPQIIRRRGREVAVVVSIDTWRATQPTIADLLQSDEARGDWLEGAAVGDLAVTPPELARA